MTRMRGCFMRVCLPLVLPQRCLRLRFIHLLCFGSPRPDLKRSATIPYKDRLIEGPARPAVERRTRPAPERDAPQTRFELYAGRTR